MLHSIYSITAIVLLVKPFVWRRSRCRCRRGLFKFPVEGMNKSATGPDGLVLFHSQKEFRGHKIEDVGSFLLLVLELDDDFDVISMIECKLLYA